MAIDAYTGLPRSGKSYSVVKYVIIPSLKQGRLVYTNIPLNQELYDAYPGLINQLASDWFKDLGLFANIPYGAVVAMDELWRRWPSGMKANVVPFADKEFLAEHGHLVDENGNTTRVVFVTQDLSQIAAFARDLVVMTYRTTKLDAVGASGRFRVDIYNGAVTGQRPSKVNFVRATFDKYEPDIYKFYKSSTKSKTGDVGDESRADNRASVWRSPGLLFSLIAPPILLPFFIWYVYGLFFGGIGQADKVPERPVLEAKLAPLPSANPAVVPASVVVAEPPKQAGPTYSSVWRVAGYLQRSERKEGGMPDVVILSDVYRHQRVVAATDCEYLLDSYWQCVVDGSLVVPWSGNGSGTAWADSSTKIVKSSVTAASVATSGNGT